jgi:CspA family cold shock protein
VRLQGAIKFWNSEKGFGFASRDDGGTDVFCHINEVNSDVDDLLRGARIEFEIGTGRNGKSEAKNIRVIT